MSASTAHSRPHKRHTLFSIPHPAFGKRPELSPPNSTTPASYRSPPHLPIPHRGPHPSTSGDALTGATNASFSPQVPLQSQSRWLRLPPAHTNEQLRPCHHPTNLPHQYHHSPQLIGLHQRHPQRPHHLPSGYALLPPMSTAHQPVRYLTLMTSPNVLRSPLKQQKPHMPRTTHGTLTLNFIGVGLTPSPCRHAYPRLPRTTPPLQEQHSQLQTTFPYPPPIELSLPCARSSPLTTHQILRPYAENDINHNHAANLRKSKAAYTVNKSRPA